VGRVDVKFFSPYISTVDAVARVFYFIFFFLKERKKEKQN